jgi:pentatricopeptide repeat protein
MIGIGEEAFVATHGRGLATPTVSTYRLVIECCVKSQQAEQSLQVLQSCVKRGLVPTVYSLK